MIQNWEAIITNGVGILLLGALMLNFFNKYKSRTREMRAFALMIFINMLQCVIEPATYLIDGLRFPGDVQIATVLNALLYINNICFAYMWSAYADLRVKYEIKPLWRVLKMAPAVLIMLGGVLNLFTPVFFYITPENVYHRTWMFTVAYAVTYFYLGWGTVVAYRRRNEWERYVVLPAITFMLPVIIASLVQYFFPISMLWVGTAIGLTSAYISLLDENSTVDPLSGAFSRHYLNQQLSALPRMLRGDRTVAGIMLDVDDFKQINDCCGHLVGDDVIRNVGAVLRRAVRGDGMVFRYAGDEFTVILFIDREEEVKAILRRIDAEVEAFNGAEERPYRLSFSKGYALLVPEENVNAFVKRMDDAMYADKKSK